jgi:hexosaminidase
MQYMLFPRAWALSEVYWSSKASRNWDVFIHKVENRFYRMDVAAINYSKAIYDPIISANLSEKQILTVNIETEAPGLDVYYTMDDAMPDKFCSKYTQPFIVPEGPVTLRLISYRDGKPIGHLITLKREELVRRSGN